MSLYTAKPVDSEGNVIYEDIENSTWHELITRQKPVVRSRACKEYLYGLDILKLPKERIPQCHEITRILQMTTGWSLEPVPALISTDEFFSLLAQKKFPAATFIRRPAQLDYLTEPDIFHETFGHCPMLTNQAYADFTYTYGKLALNTNQKNREMLARLYWFTIEFGLIDSPEGIRAYGGGILSSKTETIYCLESNVPQRKSFDIIDVLRTPYRIDIMQPIYFVLNDFNTLYELTEIDLLAKVEEAQRLGMHPSVYSSL